MKKVYIKKDVMGWFGDMYHGYKIGLSEHSDGLFYRGELEKCKRYFCDEFQFDINDIEWIELG